MKHRKFTVRVLALAQPELPEPAMVIVADYMTSDSDLRGFDVYLFWVKRRWWQRDLCVGRYEARCLSQVSSEENVSDEEFLALAGVRA